MNRGNSSTRNYNKLWVAKITHWPSGGRPVLVFGVALDDENVEIDAAPGDVIRFGRKAKYSSGKSWSAWAVVQPDGDIEETTPTACRQAWDKKSKGII
jgi:hypothetical protein